MQGGQGYCVPPLRIVTSPDNSFLPGGSLPRAARGDPRRATRVLAQRGQDDRDRRPAASSSTSTPTSAALALRGRADGSCRSTTPARPARAARARCRTPASANSRCRRRCPRRCTRSGVPLARRAADGAARGRAHGDRHARDRARAVGVVAEAHVPHPGACGRGAGAWPARAPCPPVTGRRKLVLFDSPIAVSPCSAHRQRGRQRGHRLGHRRVHAAVDEARRLLELVAHASPARAPRCRSTPAARGRTAGRSPRIDSLSSLARRASPSGRHDSLRSFAGHRPVRAPPAAADAHTT